MGDLNKRLDKNLICGKLSNRNHLFGKERSLVFDLRTILHDSEKRTKIQIKTTISRSEEEIEKNQERIIVNLKKFSTDDESLEMKRVDCLLKYLFLKTQRQTKNKKSQEKIFRQNWNRGGIKVVRKQLRRSIEGTPFITNTSGIFKSEAMKTFMVRG